MSRAVKLMLLSAIVAGCAKVQLDPLASLEGLPPEAIDDRLAMIASRCESGDDGRRAVLMLAASRLDPRNPWSHPDSAALMAARHLRLTGAPIEERQIAESLYLVALELGATWGIVPTWVEVPGTPSPRFEDCASEFEPPATPLRLPILGREPLAARLRQAESGLDSLDLANQRNETARSELEASRRALEARVAELEAELQRIRRLLLARPDTTRSPR